MENLKKRILVFVDRLENDDDYDMSEEMQDEYHDIVQEIDYHDNSYELSELFTKVTQGHETPDDLYNNILGQYFNNED